MFIYVCNYCKYARAMFGLIKNKTYMFFSTYVTVCDITTP